MAGHRKPVFIRQPLNKANPPLEVAKLASCARFRYDTDRVRFFPPARLKAARESNVERKNLRLPKEKNRGALLGSSIIWGTKKELAALLSDEGLLRLSTSKDATMDLFRNDTEIRIFMDLAAKVLKEPKLPPIC